MNGRASPLEGRRQVPAEDTVVFTTVKDRDRRPERCVLCCLTFEEEDVGPLSPIWVSGDDVQYRREGSKNILTLTLLKEEPNKKEAP